MVVVSPVDGGQREGFTRGRRIRDLMHQDEQRPVGVVTALMPAEVAHTIMRAQVGQGAGSVMTAGPDPVDLAGVDVVGLGAVELEPAGVAVGGVKHGQPGGLEGLVRDR